MKKYLIDGNNLIGQTEGLKHLQSRDRQGARSKLVAMLDRYFAGKRYKVIIYLDGFESELIRSSKGRIKYSDARPADDLIREDIEFSKNPKNLIVVSSDRSVMDFAKKCSCDVITSSSFAAKMHNAGLKDEEEKRIDEMKNNIEEFKRLFGAED